MSHEERMKRPHVVRRIAEIADGSRDGKGGLVTSTAMERVSMFHHYASAIKDKPEPESLNNKALLEAYEDRLADMHRYSQWGSEHNFAIMALAGEWVGDLKVEILRRMNSVESLRKTR